MKYIEHVKSNLKKAVDVKLGRHTVLVGPNGAGKSSVIQSIDLAVRGTVRDGEGRDDIKLLGAIARFFPDNANTLQTSVRLNDETTEFAWEAKNDGKTPKVTLKKHADMSGGEVRYLFEEVQEVLSKDAGQVRSWLSNFALGKLTLAEVEDVLSKDEAEEITLMVKAEGTAIDWNVLSKAAKQRATAMRREATAKEKTVESFTEGAEAPMSEAEITKLRAEVEQLTLKIGDARRQNSERDGLWRSIESTAAEYDRLSAKTLEVVATPEELESHRVISALGRVFTDYLKVAGDHGYCEVCGQDVKAGTITARQKAVAAHEAKLVGARDAMNTKTWLDATQAQLTQMVERYQKMQEVPTEAMIERRVKVEGMISSQTSSRKTWETAKSVRTEVKNIRRRADTLTQAAEMLSDLGRKKLANGVDRFCESVNVYLSGESVGIDIDAGRIGFLREGQLHTALSGGEWTKLVLALAAYVHDRTATKYQDALTLLIPADRAWDSETLAGVMTALSDFDGQVILMSTVPPVASYEGEWSVIRVG